MKKQESKKKLTRSIKLSIFLMHATSDVKLAVDVIEGLDLEENTLVQGEKNELELKPENVAMVSSDIPRKAATNHDAEIDKLNDEEHEALVEKTTDATLENVPFPFDPGIEIDATEDSHNKKFKLKKKQPRMIQKAKMSP